MITKIKAILALGSFFAASVVFAAPEVGQPAPDFTLTDSNGETHSLADFRGKHVVLEWLNHDCPFVRKFYGPGQMQAWQKEVTDAGDVWLVINSSAVGKQGHLTPAAANEISQSKNAAHTALLLDHDGQVGRAFGARVTPHMYVINAEGVLVYNGAIDSISSANSADIEKAEPHAMAAWNASREGIPVERAVTRAYGCGIKY
jgi:peroxiredoxin